MKAVVRAALLGVLVVVLAQCAGGLQGCTDIPQRSTGPCQIGQPFGGYYDDSWKSYP